MINGINLKTKLTFALQKMYFLFLHKPTSYDRLDEFRGLVMTTFYWRYKHTFSLFDSSGYYLILISLKLCSCD